MATPNITVVYKWTANPGKLDELTAIYDRVTNEMKANEPGANAVQVYVSKTENALYVRDEFDDAGALAFHLQNTAGAHFPELLAVAKPGSFLFFGDVPEELQQGAVQMGLAAEFGSSAFGFDRAQA